METSRSAQPQMALNQTQYDLIIIGGGINGAGIARDASLRGLNVAIVEQNTWGSGTSSKSSKLAHGGLRYLEHFKFALVKESLRERNILLKTAPDYVEPLEFLFPIYTHSKRPLWQIRIGMWLYRYLAEKSKLSHYSIINSETISTHCPVLNTNKLTGGALYFDAKMKDLELVIACINDAKVHNATCLEHAKVTELIKHNKQIAGIKIHFENSEHQLYAPHIINTTGAWANSIQALDHPTKKPLVSPTKGVHLYVKNLGLKQALTLEAPQDNRIFFMIPGQNNTLIGTTDTPFNEDPNTVNVDQTDIDYLLTACNHYLKNQPLRESDIISSYAGLRPLQHSAKTASSRSRDFTLTQAKSGLWHMFGGKYTAFRHMAEVAVDTIIKTSTLRKTLSPCQTKTRPLPKP